MGDTEQVISFTAETIEAIRLHCNSYAAMRNAVTIGITPMTHMQFAQFCNDNARILGMVMDKPPVDVVRTLYRYALNGTVSVGNDGENTAFRELLGCLIGLSEMRLARQSSGEYR